MTDRIRLHDSNRAATSRTVDDLLRRGLLSRQADGADRRIKRLQLTDKGRAALQSLACLRETA